MTNEKTINNELVTNDAVKITLGEKTGTREATRSEIEAEIKRIEADFENQIAAENRKISFNTTKENLIEMQVKRLDTRITALKKQLEKIEEAEGDGIDKATPKFKGIG